MVRYFYYFSRFATVFSTELFCHLYYLLHTKRQSLLMKLSTQLKWRSNASVIHIQNSISLIVRRLLQFVFLFKPTLQWYRSILLQNLNNCSQEWYWYHSQGNGIKSAALLHLCILPVSFFSLERETLIMNRPFGKILFEFLGTSAYQSVKSFWRCKVLIVYNR